MAWEPLKQMGDGTWLTWFTAPYPPPVDSRSYYVIPPEHTPGSPTYQNVKNPPVT